jgi:histidinol-phosphatase (PHP family)
MLDYHLHLWPHGQRDEAPTVEHVAAYWERASRAGVVEIALTEHLFRFVQADRLLSGWWASEPDEALRRSMAAYWADHARADLDAYVSCALACRDAGLPVVLGLEVDFYPGRMHEVADLLAGYPFDVLLGSVHWLGTWRFDDLDDPVSMAGWSARSVDAAWDAYVMAVEELAATGTCDVLAHLDLVKVAGHRPAGLDPWWDRLAAAAADHGLAVEVSSAGWRKPAAEAYPATGLLERLVRAGVGLTTASDAHRSPDVAHRAADLAALVRRAGADGLVGFRGRQRHRVPLVLGEVGDTSPVPGDGRRASGTTAADSAVAGAGPGERGRP